MTTNVVAFGKRAINELRILLRVPAQHKKRRAGAAALQQIKQLRGEHDAWTIIVGQGKNSVPRYFSSNLIHPIVPPYPGRKIDCRSRQSDGGRAGSRHAVRHIALTHNV
jgi:hypothetical protein